MSVLHIDFGEALKKGPLTIRQEGMTSEDFFEFSRRNPTLNMERNANGDVVLMAPADAYGESRNAEIIIDLGVWNRSLPELGLVFTSSAGFRLPVGDRAPDAAWIPANRWNALTPEQRESFAQICPDFVVELMSPSDSVTSSKGKMNEWMASGTRLGLLIDRKRRRVFVYRPDQPVQELKNPAEVPCDPELSGFTLKMARIFA
jgi:Uma2 family endonuclease